jgi:hypothetical protein
MDASVAVALTVLLAGSLCVSALVVELTRQRSAGVIDFQFSATCVYAALFGLGPILVFFLWASDSIPPEWLFVTNIPPTSGYYTFAVAVALAAYFVLLLGIRLGTSDGVISRSVVRPRALLVSGALIAMIGLASLLLYARDIGGVQFMLESILAYRASAEPVYSRLGFLKTLSPLATAGAFLLFAAMQMGRRSMATRAAFLLAVSISMAALLVNGGRLMVIQFLVAFPLYFILRATRRTSLVMLAIGVAIFVGFAVFGHGIFDLFRGTERISEQIEFAARSPTELGVRFGLEFSYPVQSLSVSLRDVGADPYFFRWFNDIPLGLAYLMPKRLFSLELPPTVTMQLGELAQAPVPADLLSFGYWSAGPLGLVAIVIFFGWFLARLEAWLPLHSDPAMLVLRAAWIAYIGTRVMYGNPHHTFITALPLVVATAIVLLASRRTTIPDARPDISG